MVVVDKQYDTPYSCFLLLMVLSYQTPTKKKRGAFGRVGASPMKDRIAVPPKVNKVYSLLQKVTGNIGGNGETYKTT